MMRIAPANAFSMVKPHQHTYLIDMNGLKAINDRHGHRAGDTAIRTYLEAVVATFGEHGEAYRGEGGDEVVVLLIANPCR
jgi:GGDEF domain-containing protein